MILSGSENIMILARHVHCSWLRYNARTVSSQTDSQPQSKLFYSKRLAT